ALVYGRVTPPSGRIEAPIGRHPRHRKKMAVVFGGREAITHYRVISHIGRYSLLRLNLETGRTHQIRVHLSSIGYPVVGDPTYTQVNWGDLPPELTLPQALHACRIVFVHPRTSETMEFSVPLPEEFRRGLQALSIISGETGPIF
ncbi:MAG TPA: RluA family pseudouridine synthase, partial [Candidatus Limnocylindrales bacterium]|nr:RluA family pseudouridine synthase [Candidatus Limnocylindrales bacterium]